MTHSAKKLRIRFGLKWLVIVGPILVAGVGMYLKGVRDRQRVESLVASIAPNPSRPRIHYDYELDGDGNPVRGGRSGFPSVMLNVFGPSYFHDIIGVNLDAGPEGVSISDLASLASLNNLKSLDLEYNELSPECLQTISTLYSLEELDLQETGVRDEDLKSLESLPNLRWLRLSGRQLTDKALRHLRNARRLESLSIRSSSVRGAGLADLRCDATLTRLDLYDSPVSDQFMETILRFKKLEELDLRGAELSDGALAQLVSLRCLSTLQLSFKPDAATMNALKAALPNCKIEFERQKSPNNTN